MATDSKPHLSLAVVGHVDAGKSTVVGHLLFQSGCIPQRHMNKLERESAELGKASFKFAWVTDTTREERERAITINVSTSRLETPARTLTVLDAPGHRDFVRNMITGTASADAALLVVAAGEGEFAAGASSIGQTREHALLMFALGVKQLVVAVNKMDGHEAAYSQARYEAIKRELSELLGNVGFQSSAVTFVPVSGWIGDNLFARSANMPWYDGPTLLEALDALAVPRRVADKPLRITIQNVFKIAGVGTVATGCVETGELKPGMTLAFGPSNVSAVVGSIERHHTQVSEARPGDQVGFTLHGLPATADLRRGFVASDAGLDPAKAAAEFTVQLVIVNAFRPLRRGYRPTVHCHSAMVACRFKDITEKLDRTTGTVAETNPESVTTGDACTVVLVPESRAMTVEAFQQYPALGRVIVRNSGTTVAVGIIKAVKKHEVPAKRKVRADEPPAPAPTPTGDAEPAPTAVAAVAAAGP